MSRRAVFLDRDGTLNVRPPAHEYVTSPDGFVWLSGARRAVAELGAAGYVLAVVSNQRGVARGLVTADVLAAIDARIQRDLRAYGCAIEAFRYCVHDTDAGCGCRKPRPGMLLDLARTLDIDLGRSWMIGDSASDALAGQAVGCRTALIAPADAGVQVDIVGRSLAEVAREIVGQESDRRPQAQRGRRANSPTSAR